MSRRAPPWDLGAVAFDLDGTLVDTLPDIAAAANQMLADLGRPSADLARVRGFVGDGIARLTKRLITGEQAGEPAPELASRGLESFIQHYREHFLRASRPYPGALELLRGLRAQGLRLYCVTNKAAAFTRPLLAHCALAPFFDLVLSGDDLPTRKPDPAPLLACCAQAGLDPERLLMVGDSANDVLCARAAGSPVVCVSYGYCGEGDVRSLGPDAIVDRLEELPSFLRSPSRP